MPNGIDPQVLQDYVATANSGKYKSWEEINLKFPELKDYDTEVLKDYVSTANSGKYKSWEEINSKFPEFDFGGEKKNFGQQQKTGGTPGAGEAQYTKENKQILLPTDEGAFRVATEEEGALIAPSPGLGGGGIPEEQKQKLPKLPDFKVQFPDLAGKQDVLKTPTTGELEVQAQKEIPEYQKKMGEFYGWIKENADAYDSPEAKKQFFDELDNSALSGEEREEAYRTLIKQQEAKRIAEQQNQEMENVRMMPGGQQMDPVVAFQKISERNKALGLQKLNQNQRKLYELNGQIAELEAKPNKTRQDQLKLADLENQRQQTDPTYKQLYNVRTGGVIGTEQEKQEAKAYEGEVNRKAQEYAKKLTYAEQLNKVFQNNANRYKYWQNLYKTGIPTIDVVAQRKKADDLEKRGLVDQANELRRAADNATVIPVWEALNDPNFQNTAMGNEAREISNNYIESKRDFDAINQAYLLNKNITVDKDAVYHAKLFLDKFVEGFIPEAFTTAGVIDNPDLSNRAYIDTFGKIMQEEGVNLTKEQEESFKTTLGESINEGIAGLGSIGVKLFIARNLVDIPAELIGLKRIIDVYKKGTPLQKVLGGAMELTMEEGVGQFAGMPTGTMTGFALANKAMSKAGFKFKGKLGAIIQPFFNKVVAGSIGGTTGMELGSALSKTVDGLMNDKDWMAMINEDYNDLSEDKKRILSELVVNGVFGFTALKKGDAVVSSKKLRALAAELMQKGKPEDAQEVLKKAKQIERINTIEADREIAEKGLATGKVVDMSRVVYPKGTVRRERPAPEKPYEVSAEEPAAVVEFEMVDGKPVAKMAEEPAAMKPEDMTIAGGGGVKPEEVVPGVEAPKIEVKYEEPGAKTEFEEVMPAEAPAEPLKDVKSIAKALEGVKEFKAESSKYFEYVPVEEIEKYKEFDRETEKKWGSKDNTLEELVDDIRENGIKTPITLQIDRDGNALIVEGNTRLAAAKKLGIKNIPVRVVSGEFGSINKEKARKIDKKRSVGEMKVFYPNVKLLDIDNSAASLGFTSITETKNISEAYLADKAAGRETELVKAVEDLLGEKPVEKPAEKPAEEAPKEEVKPETVEPAEKVEAKEEATETEITKTAETTGANPKNIRDLYRANRDIFKLNKVNSLASAITIDRMIGQMAKRAGVSKEEMYSKLEIKKATKQDLPKGVLLQVEAMHGSRYEFDKFTTEKIGTGEGKQAFGWGLYFTDLESIARTYATSLASKAKYSFEGIDDIDNVSTHPMTKAFLEDMLKTNPSSRKDAIRWVEENSRGKSEKVLTELMNFAKTLNIDESVGRILYKTTLHKGKTPDQYIWLEWDKKLPDSVKQKIKDGIKKLDLENKKTELNKQFEEKYNQIKDKVSSRRNLQFVIENFNKTNSYEIIKSELSDSDMQIVKDLHSIYKESRAIENLLDFDYQLNNFDGKNVYLQLAELLGGPKEASLFLLENGVDGNKYPAESLSRGATSETARGFNYVVFDENAVTIEEVIKFQKDANKARGAAMIGLDGKAIVYALTDPNVSTPMHELAHVYEHYLTDSERATIIKSAGTKKWTTKTSEYFARGFEKYLSEGKAPSPELKGAFERFKKWLLDIYQGIKDSEIDVKLNKDMRRIYDEMLGAEPKKAKTPSEAPKAEAPKAEPAKAEAPKVELPKMEGEPKAEPKVEGEKFVPETENIAKFEAVDELAKELEKKKSQAGKEKVQQRISKEMQKMTEYEKYVEQNADAIMEELKEKGILKSPCK
jgi:ParB-like chromosome segregation protein Spo0J